ncbi:uncharacterized protein L3040_007732 [Drepanopeziza brunnea f. sp. 'multigermtubi']|uniref:uncharacterized protein n=1 Tax=Drepanopeziza brunnea f. sp. 'multigermtubi' TaxID=698441 RepID=UPI00238872BA|nr:hypothetical protein L3040_007732 [Drepanopeziza brunnea f. sp. 'multigermtubi']
MSYKLDSRSSMNRGRGDSQDALTYTGGCYSRDGLTPPIAAVGPRKRKMYRPNTTWTWAFMIAAIIQAVIVLAIEAYLFAKLQLSIQPGHQKQPLAKTIPTYLTLFIFGFLYQLLLVYDSLRLKNTIQVIGLCIYNAGMLIYGSIQYDQIKTSIDRLGNKQWLDPERGDLWHDIKPFLITVPCVIAFFTIVISVIAWKLYDEFAWTIYKHISADLRMKRRFLTFQIYIALLKFDFFFFLGFTVQFLVVVTGLADVEFGLTIAAIPVTIGILFMAAWFTRRENKIGMVCILLLYFCGLAYFIFKLTRMYQPSREVNYLPVRKSLTSFAVLTIILIILTIANACVCMANFDKGLRPHIMRREIGGEEVEKMEHMTELPDLKHGQPLPISSRMTID